MKAWLSSNAKDIRRSSVANQLARQREEDILMNRAYLTKVIETLVFLAQQNIAIRGTGKNETRNNLGDVTDANRGNFLELLSLRCRDLPWLNKKLADLLKQHSQWTSPTIQNEILNIVTGKVLQYITDEVKKAGPFSVIADETADISREEQVAIYLRYITNGTINERFLGKFKGS